MAIILPISIPNTILLYILLCYDKFYFFSCTISQKTIFLETIEHKSQGILLLMLQLQNQAFCWVLKKQGQN